MLKGFKTFLLRGNIVDLAIAVVVGTAFTAVVSAFVSAFITPLIAVLWGRGDVFHGLAFTVDGVSFPIYMFLDKLVTFLVIAAIVYFLVFLPVQRVVEYYRHAETPDPTTKKCPECLSEIPLGARKCAFCTSVQPAGDDRRAQAEKRSEAV
jgi:large conductance mechanosensitive channel